MPTVARTFWAQYFRRYWHYGFYRCHRIFEDHGAVGPKGGGKRPGNVQGPSLTATTPVKGLVALTVPEPVWCWRSCRWCRCADRGDGGKGIGWPGQCPRTGGRSAGGGEHAHGVAGGHIERAAVEGVFEAQLGRGEAGAGVHAGEDEQADGNVLGQRPGPWVLVPWAMFRRSVTFSRSFGVGDDTVRRPPKGGTVRSIYLFTHPTAG